MVVHYSGLRRPPAFKRGEKSSLLVTIGLSRVIENWFTHRKPAPQNVKEGRQGRFAEPVQYYLGGEKQYLVVVVTTQ